MDRHDAYGRTSADIAAILRAHERYDHDALMVEAGRMVAVRGRVRRRYGPDAAARVVAPVGHDLCPARTDAGAGRPAAATPVTTARQPLPAAPPRPARREDTAVGLALTGRELGRAIARLRDRLRAALRIGEGAMPG